MIWKVIPELPLFHHTEREYPGPTAILSLPENLLLILHMLFATKGPQCPEKALQVRELKGTLEKGVTVAGSRTTVALEQQWSGVGW